MSRIKLRPKFITDSKGVKTAVVLDMKEYEEFLALIEEADDVEYVKSVRNEPARSYQDYRKRRSAIKSRQKD